MVEINVLGHRFNFPCAPEEKARLQKAAQLIEHKMNELPKANRNERALIMVAINIAYDLLQLKEETQEHGSDLRVKIEEIHLLLTQALQQQALSDAERNALATTAYPN
ncbi:MAG: cell division protein ZapA [Thiotrichales bacterium]|nr:cell division protein ZapA [Thiotrichales bacterium]